METIIGLLIILMPVIMKLIGKKLDQAGKADQARKVRDLAKALGSDDDADEDEDVLKKWLEGDKEPEVEYDDDGQITFVEPVVPQPAPGPVAVEPLATAPAVPAAARSRSATSMRKTMLLEEEKPKKGEKIDPRKLVIYSEIMKPKYNE